MVVGFVSKINEFFKLTLRGISFWIVYVIDDEETPDR